MHAPRNNEDENDMMLQLPFEIATCESTTFSSEIATVAVTTLIMLGVSKAVLTPPLLLDSHFWLVMTFVPSPTMTLTLTTNVSALLSRSLHPKRLSKLVARVFFVAEKYSQRKTSFEWGTWLIRQMRPHAAAALNCNHFFNCPDLIGK